MVYKYWTLTQRYDGLCYEGSYETEEAAREALTVLAEAGYAWFYILPQYSEELPEVSTLEAYIERWSK